MTPEPPLVQLQSPTRSDHLAATPMKQTIRISEGDNVLVALAAIPAGTAVAGLVTLNDIPAGHKLAASPIRSGELVVKYGYPIGAATRDILAGEHIHSHNLQSILRGDLTATTATGAVGDMTGPKVGARWRANAVWGPGARAARQYMTAIVTTSAA